VLFKGFDFGMCAKSLGGLYNAAVKGVGGNRQRTRLKFVQNGGKGMGVPVWLKVFSASLWEHEVGGA